jgi:hypothetical protein
MPESVGLLPLSEQSNVHQRAFETPPDGFDKATENGRVEKLPWKASREAEGQEHPILENSTACTMSNAKNLVFRIQFLAGEEREIPLENI